MFAPLSVSFFLLREAPFISLFTMFCCGTPALTVHGPDLGPLNCTSNAVLPWHTHCGILGQPPAEGIVGAGSVGKCGLHFLDAAGVQMDPEPSKSVAGADSLF